MRRYMLLGTALGVVLFLGLWTGSVLGSGAKVIRVLDECEMDSFNDLFGPGICIKNGKVTVDKFLDYLAEHQRHPLWRFGPNHTALPSGKVLVLENSGGEFHTFTQVAEFGGGFIPDLNFGQDPRPECFLGPSATSLFLDAGERELGPASGTAALPAGETKWQCCVHPWMRTTVRVP